MLWYASIEQKKSSIDLANSTYQRRKIFGIQKIGSEQEFLQAKNIVESLEKQMDMLKEQLDMTNGMLRSQAQPNR
jgi:multidrug resistance efflux pump